MYKASVNFDCIPLYSDSNPCTIVQIQSPNEEVPQDYADPIYTCVSPATINQYLDAVRMKDVDIVIALDGCAVKKTGRNVEVMPKIKATQIVIK